MDPAQLKQKIKTLANQKGFPLVGVTHPQKIPNFNRYQAWIEKGHHATMHYLSSERALHMRQNPKNLFPSTQSILVVGMLFENPAYAEQVSSTKDGKIATYAYHLDYHDILKKRLIELSQEVQTWLDFPLEAKAYVDTAPLLERELGQLAGLGWIGKNSMLINPVYGSAFFIGSILWNLPLEKDAPFTGDYCGQCNRCRANCPTKAIQSDRTLDSNLCLSFLTIENREEIPPQFHQANANHVFGCDICLQVCPWNHKRKQSEVDPAYHLRENYQSLRLAEELTLTQEQFSKKFTKSAIKRTKWHGYLRNVIIAAGNSMDAACLAPLEALTKSTDPIHRQHAQWSLDKLKNDLKNAKNVKMP